MDWLDKFIESHRDTEEFQRRYQERKVAVDKAMKENPYLYRLSYPCRIEQYVAQNMIAELETIISWEEFGF